MLTQDKIDEVYDQNVKEETKRLWDNSYKKYFMMSAIGGFIVSWICGMMFSSMSGPLAVIILIVAMGGFMWHFHNKCKANAIEFATRERRTHMMIMEASNNKKDE